jgi:hypothetical protein
MAHPAVETQLAQPAYEVTDAQHHKETSHTLREFWKSTAALRTVLDRGRSFNDLELRLLENHSRFTDGLSWDEAETRCLDNEIAH